MIKVFNVLVKLFNADELIESAQSHFVVQDDKPNVLQAMEIARDMAIDNIGLDYAYMAANGGVLLKEYPLDGGCGIEYKDFINTHKEDDIFNADDLYDMQFDFDDLPEESQAQAIGLCKESATSYSWWRNKKCIPAWIDKARKEYGLSIDQADISFSLGYVQSDFADFSVDFVEDYNVLLNAIGIEIDKLPFRQKYLLKHIIKEKLINIDMDSITRQAYTNEVDVRLDVFSRKYGMPTELYALRNKLTDLIDEQIDGFYSDLRQDLYQHIRKYYEEYIDTDANVIGFIKDNGFTFDINGECNGN